MGGHAQVGGRFVGEPPLWVEDHRPSGEHGVPFVLLHGSALTGACWFTTASGEPGWLPTLLARGRRCLVVEWPGHGRAASTLARVGDLSLSAVCAGVVELLDDVGPAVLVTHSRSAVVGWSVLRVRPEQLAGIVALAPSPPAHLLSAGLPEIDVGQIVWPDVLSTDYHSPRLPPEDHAAAACFLAPEGTTSLAERHGQLEMHPPAARGPVGVPVWVVTGDHDPHHSRGADFAIARHYGGRHVWLADHGLPGHGHLMMLERGAGRVADLIIDHVDRSTR